MNSLRVDGLSCGLLTERAWEGRSGCVKRAVAAIWASMPFRVVGGRLVRDVLSPI